MVWARYRAKLNHLVLSGFGWYREERTCVLGGCGQYKECVTPLKMAFGCGNMSG
jgi:hypothetical protein